MCYLNTGAQDTKMCFMTEIEGLGVLITIIYDFTSETSLQCINQLCKVVCDVKYIQGIELCSQS